MTQTNEKMSVLLKQLKAGNKTERTAAAEALCKLGNKSAVNDLIRALDDPEEKVRRLAADALGNIGDTRAVEPLISALIRAESSMYVRSRLTIALKKLGAVSVPLLLENLKSDDVDTRIRAIEALGVLADKSTMTHLLDAMQDRDERVVCITVEALGNFGPEALQPVLKAISNKNVAVRRRATEALGRIRDPGAIPALLQALQDRDVYVRDKAAVALGKIGDPCAIEDLIDALYDCNWGAGEALKSFGAEALEPLSRALYFDKIGSRTRAAQIMMDIGGTKTIGPLSRAMKSDSWGIRQTAVEILSKLDDIAVFDTLVAALDDPYWSVRKSAAEALGRLGDRRAVEPLKKLLQDPDGIVSTSAQDALEQL